jgi:hypothetical protein
LRKTPDNVLRPRLLSAAMHCCDAIELLSGNFGVIGHAVLVLGTLARMKDAPRGPRAGLRVRRFVAEQLSRQSPITHVENLDITS